MKRGLLALAVVVLTATLAQAGDAPQAGTLISENSVPCGSKTQGKKNTKTTEELCQEYVIRGNNTDYHVRQQKPSDKALIPVNAAVEYTLDKDKMKFKANGKSYEYLVVSEAAAGSAPAAATR